MAIPIQCEKCNSRYRVADRMAGKRVRCKGCQATISVPDDTEELEELPDEPPVAPAPRLGAAPPWFADPPPPPGFAQPGNPQQPGFSPAPGMPGMPGMPFPNMGYGIPGYGQPGMGQPGMGAMGQPGMGFQGMPGMGYGPPGSMSTGAAKPRKKKRQEPSYDPVRWAKLAGAALILVSGLNMLALFRMGFRALQSDLTNPALPDYGRIGSAIATVIGLCIVFGVQAVVMSGGFSLMNQTSYLKAFAGAFLVIIPCSMFIWPLGIAAGLFALVIVNLEGVKRLFD